MTNLIVTNNSQLTDYTKWLMEQVLWEVSREDAEEMITMYINSIEYLYQQNVPKNTERG